MARYIDADHLCEGRVCNDPVVIAAKCEPTADVQEVKHGRWQKCYRGGSPLWDEETVCSECRHTG